MTATNTDFLWVSFSLTKWDQEALTIDEPEVEDDQTNDEEQAREEVLGVHHIEHHDRPSIG